MGSNVRQDELRAKVFLLINCAFFVAFIGVLALTLSDKSRMQFAFSYISYYIILALVVTWACVLVIFWRQKMGSFGLFVRSHWVGLVFSLCLASMIFLSVPKYFRVLSDETNLLSVARSMTFNKNVHNVTEGKSYYEMFWVSAESITEKRPFLFPFAVSVTHNLFGYHPDNVFLFNFVVLWGALFLIYMIIRSSLSPIWAFAAMLLVVAQPVIALSATSGSFEIFNLFLILLSFLSLRFFLKGQDGISFTFLVMNLTMLANVRYESVIFLIFVIAVLLVGGYLRFSLLKETCFWGMVPFFFLSLIWQRIVMLGVADSNLTGGSWVKAISLSNIGKNSTLFAKYIFDLNGSLGYAGLINWVGLLVIILFIFRILLLPKDFYQKAKLSLLIICVLSICTLLGIMLSYQGHIADHPMNGRLYIPFIFVLSVLPIYFLADIIKDKARFAMAIFIGAGALFVYYHPVAMEDRLTNQLYIIRDFRFVNDFLKSNADQNSLVICGRPGQVIVYNYGALSFDTANKNKDEIMQQYRNRLFNVIYVVQEINYKTKLPEPSNAVDPVYQLKSVAERQGGPTYFIRISEVINPEIMR